jgi:hypothetical protein
VGSGVAECGAISESATMRSGSVEELLLPDWQDRSLLLYVSGQLLSRRDDCQQTRRAEDRKEDTPCNTMRHVIPTARNCDSLGIPKSVKL